VRTTHIPNILLDRQAAQTDCVLGVLGCRCDAVLGVSLNDWEPAPRLFLNCSVCLLVQSRLPESIEIPLEEGDLSEVVAKSGSWWEIGASFFCSFYPFGVFGCRRRQSMPPNLPQTASNFQTFCQISQKSPQTATNSHSSRLNSSNFLRNTQASAWFHQIQAKPANIFSPSSRQGQCLR
jgi:hypothetical protein